MNGSSVLRWLACVLVGLAVAACRTAPIYESSSSVPAGLSAQQVQAAVVTAMGRRGWIVEEYSAGGVLARIDVRGTHTAKVKIPYDSQQYAIRYADSSGLNHGDGVIHRNYNKWVILLDREIQRELIRAAYPRPDDGVAAGRPTEAP
jgi:hypothetical protein